MSLYVEEVAVEDVRYTLMLDKMRRAGSSVFKRIEFDYASPRDIRNVLPTDYKDTSEHPSYTHFEVPYYLQCRFRYHLNRVEYERQFQYELDQILNQLSSAFEAARFVRHLCITTLWPPLHNRQEISQAKHFFKLTPKQRKRLKIIMNTNYENH